MKVKYKNWSINKKLLSISLSAFLPMVILAAYLIVSLNNAASAYSEITKSVAYANRYVKDFKSRLDYSMYLAVVSNMQLKEVDALHILFQHGSDLVFVTHVLYDAAQRMLLR